MCLIVIAYKVHPRYKIIVAANRDEYYARPTRFLDFWEENPNILAGRDLKSMGTWLGVTKKGKFSALTNYRDPKAVKEGRPSRGLLVKRFLESDIDPEEYLKFVKKESSKYNPFNLIVGDKKSLWYYSNRADIKRLKPGLYGLSNHLLDTSWPKVKKAKQEIKKLIEEKDINIEKIFLVLKDKSVPPDHELPDTGIGYAKERMLAPIFVETPNYGTRCSSVILIEEKLIHFYEINYIPNSSKEVWLEFHIFID